MSKYAKRTKRKAKKLINLFSPTVLRIDAKIKREMASTSQAAAAKRSRSSAEQLSSLLDFLTEFPGLATGKFQKLHGKLENEKKWAEIAAKLNSIRGAAKSVDQWHTVWRDLKSRTSVKARDRKRQQALTGNRPLDQAPMTELEMRVIGLIGSSYVEGNDIPENIPTEEEFQLALEDGDEGVFKLLIDEDNESRCETPITSTPKTPRRSFKKKRVEEDIDLRMKVLEIAEKQADGLKMLAECSSANTRLANSMTEATNALSGAILTLGEGLKATAEAFNNLANSINKI